MVTIANLAVGGCRPSAQVAPALAPVAVIGVSTTARAVYVQDAATLMTSAAGRARLLELVAAGDITDVVPYGLGELLATTAGQTRLAGWLAELRAAGARVIVPIAGRDRLEALDNLVVTHPDLRLDGLVTELEYWNRSDRAAAFRDLLALVDGMRATGAVWSAAWSATGPGAAPVTIGVYLGYPTASEARQLVGRIDHAFVNYPVRSPAQAWRHRHARGGELRDRFAWLARGGVAVWPIFYAAGEVDMAAALRAHGPAAAERRLRADLAADAELRDLAVAGFVYFTFEAMVDLGWRPTAPPR